MSEPTWTGAIHFGRVSFPAELHAADAPDEGAFSQLDRRDMAPVTPRWVNLGTGQDVPAEAVTPALAVGPGRVVPLDDDLCTAADAEATRSIELLDFVDPGQISPMFYARPFLVSPSPGGERSYALLREALRRCRTVGIARLVLPPRSHLAALLTQGPALVLVVLRYPHELRSPTDLSLPGNDLEALGISERELDLAERLVGELEAPWEPEQYHDDYQPALLEAALRRSAGAPLVSPPVPIPEPDGPLDLLLEQSLELAGGSERARSGWARSDPGPARGAEREPHRPGEGRLDPERSAP